MMSWRGLWALVLLGLFLGACHKQPHSKQAHAKSKSHKPHKSKKHKNLFIKKSAAQRAQEEQAKLNQEIDKFRLIYIYTPMLRYYDYGSIEKTKEGEIEMVLYKLGQRFGDILIKKNYICFSGTCSAKWSVARDMFGKVSYGDLFDDIVLGRDIFMGMGKRLEPNGDLIQRFVENGELIYYERNADRTLFQNMTTGIAISLQRYHP
ncbi:HP0838 family lipoprotein [Helicobacter bizzozeronii]|uniref:HP0838 family lipoprotein n=1 Tax=Helicobacter bizzozeronii TaxID=56877 RepID=UPI0018F856C5|nr:hypothetical protein [Helicobacter bizzozeronii]